MNNLVHSFALVIFFALPLSASAQVLITELMYDLEGSDGGYEWIEVTNTSATAVDLGSWRLFEQGVNHKLKVVSGGSTILQPGASALIADKPENIIARYPGLSIVFDSAFSLSNETETIMLKNGAEKIIDQVTYRATLGAKGDGGSLHLVGEVLVPGLPNPGEYPGELVPVQTKKEKEEKTASAPLDPTAPYALAAAAPISEKTLGLLPWIVGLLSLIGIGVAGVFLVKAEEKKETKSLADEFEIIE